MQDYLLKAKEELEGLNSELNKAMTQQMILRKRQADLGSYMQDTLKKVRLDLFGLRYSVSLDVPKSNSFRIIRIEIQPWKSSFY